MSDSVVLQQSVGMDKRGRRPETPTFVDIHYAVTLSIYTTTKYDWLLW